MLEDGLVARASFIPATSIPFIPLPFPLAYPHPPLYPVRVLIRSSTLEGSPNSILNLNHGPARYHGVRYFLRERIEPYDRACAHYELPNYYLKGYPL